MKTRYDFSKGQRGKFYRPNAVLQMPVYLQPDIEAYLTKKAEATGMALSDLVNDLLKKNIDDMPSGK